MIIGHNFEIEVKLGKGIRGFVVIDSMLRNTSSGGVRIAEDISLCEVRFLARAMTFKYGFIGLDRGGAKCGISIPDDIVGPARLKILEKFGTKIAPIIQRGIYYPGMDMNCGPEELRAIYRGAGIMLGELTDTSYFTAMSLARAIKACAAMERPNRDRMLTVAIEGFGSVAKQLALRLPSDQYRIVAVSTAAGGLYNMFGFSSLQLGMRDKYGDAFVHHLPGKPLVPKEDILGLDVDFLVPSARIFCINPKNVDQVKARYVVPAANAPYAKDCHRKLSARGVVGLPGFVCNSGGVYASSLYDSGVKTERIDHLTSELFQPMVEALLIASRRTGESPVDIASRIAVQHVKSTLGEVHNSLASKAATVFERKVLPQWMRGQIVLSRFERGLVRLRAELERFESREVAA